MAEKKRAMKTPQFTMDTPALVLNVEGMTCAHCKAKVENGLKDEANITDAIADTENNTVKLYGEGIDSGRIAQKIAELGYVFKGFIR